MPLALLAVAGVLMVGSPATSDAHQPENTTAPQACKPLKRVYLEKNWRDATPKDGQPICPVPDRAGARNTASHFYLYRHYRKITPYRCLHGREGTFAIPCYIIACESHFNWWARNPSGASYIYQLLGWGAPPPSTFKNRVRNHEIAASLSLSNWACA
jgi:hypothetical protein